MTNALQLSVAKSWFKKRYEIAKAIGQGQSLEMSQRAVAVLDGDEGDNDLAVWAYQERRLCGQHDSAGIEATTVLIDMLMQQCGAETEAAAQD